MKRVLIADDDAGMLSLMERALPQYSIVVARSGPEALVLASRLQHCDLLITDYVMPVMLGDELAGRMREARPKIKTLMVTGHSALLGAVDCGADARLAKPFKCSQLREAVSTLIGA